MTRSIVFDIETAPLPDAELEQFMPKEWPLGNIKDPEKIKAAIEEKKKAWKEDAALRALTGRVLVIGMMIGDTPVILSEPGTEATIIYEFWDAVRMSETNIHNIVGFNVKLFDLPFLMQRSWKWNLTIPMDLFDGRYFSRHVVDLRERWQCGDRQAPGSLDAIARHMGIGAKSGSGKDFAGLWDQDREKALQYIKNDLDLTSKIAHRMGIL